MLIIVKFCNVKWFHVFCLCKEHKNNITYYRQNGCPQISVFITFGEGERDLEMVPKKPVNKRLVRKIWKNTNIYYMWEMFFTVLHACLKYNNKNTPMRRLLHKAVG